MSGWCKGDRGARGVGITGLPIVILSERSQCAPTSDQVSLVFKQCSKNITKYMTGDVPLKVRVPFLSVGIKQHIRVFPILYLKID